VFNIGQYWSLILGIAFIVVVLVFPQGIVGTVQKQWFKWRNKPKAVELEKAKAVGD
jgi:hypothetical protein